MVPTLRFAPTHRCMRGSVTLTPCAVGVEACVAVYRSACGRSLYCPALYPAAQEVDQNCRATIFQSAMRDRDHGMDLEDILRSFSAA